MNVRAYESYDKAKDGLNRNEYVDVMGKPIDDDNIYDNYIVERRKHDEDDKNRQTATSVDAMKLERRPCPFSGLPAAHLTIVQSPKTGCLTMHLRRRRFSRNFSLHFKRRYYAGLAMEPNEADVEPYNWWMLMYAGGMSDLKPTVCLPLNHFTVACDHTHDANIKQQKIQKIQCKFEMNEKTNVKNGKSMCFLAETPEHCEQWIDLIRQLSAGKRYIENVITATAQIRKLPMLPIAASMKFNESCVQEIDTVDTAACSMDDGIDGGQAESHITDFNNSDGVYEEPEEYYKNVKVIKGNMPNIPVKKASQSTVSTLRMDESNAIYDTPKTPVRATVADTDTNDAGKSKTHADILSTLVDTNRSNLDDVRTKLTTQFKARTNKNFSPYTCSQTQRSDDQQSVDGSTVNKHQLSIVRRFTNHLAKIRHSTNATSMMRKTTSVAVATEQRFNERGSEQKKNSGGGGDIGGCVRGGGELAKMSSISETVHSKRAVAHSIQPKGNKVHMIINQLEANGQLTLLSNATNKCNSLITSA